MFGYAPVSFVVFFSLTFFISWIMSKSNDRIKKIGALIVAIGIALFYGLRSTDIGVDTKEYVARYEGNVITEDYLFSWFGIALHSIGIDPSQYLFLISLITSLLLLIALKNFSGSYSRAAFFLSLIAIMPYGIMSYVNIARQGLAMSFILYGASVINENKAKVRNLLVNISAFFIHKTTTIIYIASLVIKAMRASRYKNLVTISLIIIVPLFALLTPYIISILGVTDKYDSFADHTTSESPYLLYLKLLWAIFHFCMLFYFGRTKKEAHILYWYLGVIIIASIATVSNALVSSRLLTSVDMVIPALYASQADYGRKSLSGGVILLFVYAIVSPYVFSMYSNNF